MAGSRSLLRSRSMNATLSWVLVVTIALAAVGRVVVGDYLWAALDLTIVAVAIVPTVLARDGSVLVSWRLLIVPAVPTVIRWTPYYVEPLTYLSVAALGLLVAAEVDAFSDVEMPPWFAVAFTVMATMAVAGVWGVVQYFSDALLGTAFIAGRVELMWDLVAATAVGVGAGVLFDRYFREFAAVPVGPREGRDR